MAFNYSKLRGRIIEKYGSQTDFAKAFGCSDRTLSLKMTGKRPWKQIEILKAIKLLDLSEDDIQDYFFALEVWAALFITPDISKKFEKALSKSISGLIEN